jgi:NAD(P) transhydrogenase subunit alpha
VTADAAGGYARELTDEERQAQQEALLAEVANSDVVITTAAVPGRRAPILVTTKMVEAMSKGSLVIDMAADGGGNCELTKAGETVEYHAGVRVVGLSNPPAEMGTHASFMFANNVLKLLALFGAKGEIAPQWDDEIVRGVTVTSGGGIHRPHGRSTRCRRGAAADEPRADDQRGRLTWETPCCSTPPCLC